MPETVSVMAGRDDDLVPVDNVGDTLVLASQLALESEAIEKLRFIFNRPVRNIVVSPDTFGALRKRRDEEGWMEC